jgi:hypothetical protein
MHDRSLLNSMPSKSIGAPRVEKDAAEVKVPVTLAHPSLLASGGPAVTHVASARRGKPDRSAHAVAERSRRRLPTAPRHSRPRPIASRQCRRGHASARPSHAAAPRLLRWPPRVGRPARHAPRRCPAGGPARSGASPRALRLACRRRRPAMTPWPIASPGPRGDRGSAPFVDSGAPPSR